MTQTPEVKHIKMNLRCNLTPDEMIAAGRELAESTNGLEELENDKTRVVSDFKAKITAEQANVAVLSNKLRSGYEFRDIECEVVMDAPKDGQKTVNRLDSGETVKVLDMTEEEKQLQLPV